MFTLEQKVDRKVLEPLGDYRYAHKAVGAVCPVGVLYRDALIVLERHCDTLKVPPPADVTCWLVLIGC